jgi:hypothetical protein
MPPCTARQAWERLHVTTEVRAAQSGGVCWATEASMAVGISCAPYQVRASVRARRWRVNWLARCTRVMVYGWGTPVLAMR